MRVKDGEITCFFSSNLQTDNFKILRDFEQSCSYLKKIKIALLNLSNKYHHLLKLNEFTQLKKYDEFNSLIIY